MRIGRYGIAFGPVFWLQTRVPTRVWHFLWFWFFKEARPQDIDTKQQFPPGTPMEQEGRVYRYWRGESGVHQDQAAINHNSLKGEKDYE